MILQIYHKPHIMVATPEQLTGQRRAAGPSTPVHAQLLPRHSALFQPYGNPSALTVAGTSHARSCRRRRSRGVRGSYRVRCGFPRAKIIPNLCVACSSHHPLLPSSYRAHAVVFLSPSRVLFPVGRILQVARGGNKTIARVQAGCRQRPLLSVSANADIYRDDIP